MPRSANKKLYTREKRTNLINYRGPVSVPAPNFPWKRGIDQYPQGTHQLTAALTMEPAFSKEQNVLEQAAQKHSFHLELQ